MSNEAETEVLTPEVTPEAPPIAPDAGETEPQTAAPPAQDTPEEQSKALGIGWMGKSEWERLGRDPQQWRPAREFLRRGETYLRLIKAERDRLRSEVGALERTTAEKMAAMQAEFEKRIARNERMNGIALEKQREQIWHNFEEKKRSAVADGNMQAYDKLNQDQRQALSEFQPDAEVDERARAEPAKPPPPQTQVQAPREVQDWVADNTWFNSDPVLTAFATKEHGRLLKAMPGISIEDNLRRTLDATKQKFPEEFGLSPAQMNGQREPHAPQVEGGGRQAQGTGKTRGWNDLPPEAKTSGDKFIRDDGLFLPKGVDTDAASETDIKKARDAYAKDYWSLS
jgi:hypothetical protein